MGKNVARILKVAIWDATVPQKGHWIKSETTK